MNDQTLTIRRFGLAPYQTTWDAMRRFTVERTPVTPDELWVLQHPPVFTLGLGGKQEHVLDAGEIPVIRTDRGGQVTYHGPGQLVIYVLLDLLRKGWGVKRLVWALEQAVIDGLAAHAIAAERRPGAPGVYVAGRKIAALGLRIKNGCSYHGLALNVAMDLEPYQRINPCGFPGLGVTQTADLGIAGDAAAVAERLLPILVSTLEDTEQCDKRSCA